MTDRMRACCTCGRVQAGTFGQACSYEPHGRLGDAIPDLQAGHRVRERSCPNGCEAWTGTVESVAPDGWVIVHKDDSFTGKPREGFLSRVSHAPREVERIS